VRGEKSYLVLTGDEEPDGFNPHASTGPTSRAFAGGFAALIAFSFPSAIAKAEAELDNGHTGEFS